MKVKEEHGGRYNHAKSYASNFMKRDTKLIIDSESIDSSTVKLLFAIYKRSQRISCWERILVPPSADYDDTLNAILLYYLCQWQG